MRDPWRRDPLQILCREKNEYASTGTAAVASAPNDR